MEFQVVSPLDYVDWNKRLAGLGSSSFFNTAEWARVLADAYGYEPCYVVGVDQGRFVDLMPMMQVSSRLTGRRGVALPFSDYCEPVGMEEGCGSRELEDFLKQLGREKGWRYCEIRTASVPGDRRPVYAKYLKHTLDLKVGEQSLFDHVESSVRTSIRKARKAGVEVTFSGDLDAVRLFYRLNCITRRRHGLPPQPFAFFKSLHQQVLATGLGQVVTAWHSGRAIAASVFCHFGGKVIFKYGASDKSFQDLRASTLVMWEAIRHYALSGCDQISLGRTEASNDGLRRFKSGWGAAESELGYMRYDFNQGRYIGNGRQGRDGGYRIVKMLPLSCSRIIGALLYKHMG